jgi:hypothetical protein
MEGLRVLGLAGGYLLANLFLAVFWTTVLARAPRGLGVSFLAAPLVPLMVSYAWLGQPHHVLFSAAWGVSLGVIVVTVVPKHRTKSGRRDRRHKHNPDTSGISSDERLVALAGVVSVTSVAVLGWWLGWPGGRLR